MSRIIKTESSTKQRNQLLRQILFALDWLDNNSSVGSAAIFDVSAYISISLREIFNSIDASVVAWEKKGYWVKADKFRMEWLWTQNYSGKLEEATLAESVEIISPLLNSIKIKLINLNVKPVKSTEDYWQGCFERLVKGKKGG